MSNTTLYINDTQANTGYREATLEELLAAATQALSRRVRKGTVSNCTYITSNFLKIRLAEKEHEVFTVIYVDKRNRFIAAEDLFRGTSMARASTHARSSRQHSSTTQPQSSSPIITPAASQNPPKPTSKSPDA